MAYSLLHALDNLNIREWNELTSTNEKKQSIFVNGSADYTFIPLNYVQKDRITGI